MSVQDAEHTIRVGGIYYDRMGKVDNDYVYPIRDDYNIYDCSCFVERKVKNTS